MGLGPMDKMILEGLEKIPDFIDASKLVDSLRLKNRFLVKLAVSAVAELVKIGLVAASGGTKIKITQSGRELLEKEGYLDQEEKNKLTE